MHKQCETYVNCLLISFSGDYVWDLKLYKVVSFQHLFAYAPYSLLYGNSASHLDEFLSRVFDFIINSAVATISAADMSFLLFSDLSV